MLGTFLALKRAKAVVANTRIHAICKVWGISTSVALVDGGVVEMSFVQEGKPIAWLKSQPGLTPWLIVQTPAPSGVGRTVLATSSVREAAGALLALLETAKK